VSKFNQAIYSLLIVANQAIYCLLIVVEPSWWNTEWRWSPQDSPMLKSIRA